MKAFDLGGKRKAMDIDQIEFAKRLGWDVRTVRDVERGFVDITPEQHKKMLNTLSEMGAKEAREEVTAA